MDRLVIIEPKELVLKYEVGEKSCASISLKNVMCTMPVAFKVQATASAKYTIKPTHGIIPPLGVVGIEITLSPQMELPESVPYSQDKFLVKSVVVPGGKDNEPVSLDWFTARRKQVFSDHGMRVIFIGGGILRKLVANGSMEDIREVLEFDGKLVDSQDEHGCTAMHIAVASRRPELVPLLLEFMADLEVKNESGQTALQEAAACGEVLIAELLLSRGARVDARNSSGWTPLYSAVVGGHAEVVSLLAEKGADVNAAASDGRTAVYMAVEAGRHACLDILLERGADMDAKGGTDREVPLHRAAAKGDNKAMELLLRYGASREVTNKRGKTPADVARALGQPGFLLLDELSLGDDLRRASRQGRIEAVQQSLTRGAPLDGEDDHRWTALHRAAFRGHVAIVSALLEEGADVESKDDAGYTPLHCATEAGHKDIVVLLLKHGTPVNARCSSGHSVFDLATLFGHAGIISLLLDWGGSREMTDKGMNDESSFSQDPDTTTNGGVSYLDKTSFLNLTTPQSSKPVKGALSSSTMNLNTLPSTI